MRSSSSTLGSSLIVTDLCTSELCRSVYTALLRAVLDATLEAPHSDGAAFGGLLAPAMPLQGQRHQLRIGE